MAKAFLTKQELESIKASNPDNYRDVAADMIIRKFKKQVERDEILEECKKRQYFMNKSEKRREKSKKARIRLKKMQKKRKRV